MRNIEKIPAMTTARVAIHRDWIQHEVTKDFSKEFVQDQAEGMLHEVLRIISSEDPRMENRRALSGLIVHFAQLQVLVMEPEPADDPTGFRGQPGITGELKAFIPELAKQEPCLREHLHGFSINSAGDQWDAVLLSYRRIWAWVQVLNAVRADLDDYNRATEKDWYRPFIAAMAASYEHTCRTSLGLPPSLDNADGMADLRGIMMGTFLNRVLEGHRYPDLVWEESMKDVFSPSETASAASQFESVGRYVSA